jgi:hypothetical protein
LWTHAASFGNSNLYTATLRVRCLEINGKAGWTVGVEHGSGIQEWVPINWFAWLVFLYCLVLLQNVCRKINGTYLFKNISTFESCVPIVLFEDKGKGKAIPLQVWTGP